ncbi:MAG: hypothetical protein AAGD96_03405 [Chloroflexota bacterium]
MSKSSTHAIGREAHMTLLQQILSREVSTRLMSVEAPRGMGKSHLLRHMAANGRADGHIVVQVDLSQVMELDSLYLIRLIRDQLQSQHAGAAEAFSLLNQTINRHARSNLAFVGVGINGRIQTVCIDKHILLENLLRLPLDQIEQILFDLHIDPPKHDVPKRQLVETLLIHTYQLDLLSDLVALAYASAPELTWWTETLPDQLVNRDQQGNLYLEDRLARQQAIFEISSALLLGIDTVSENRPLLILLDGWENGGNAACAWLIRWLVTPVITGELAEVALVIGGRKLHSIRTISNRAVHLGLEPLTRSQTHELLIQQLGYSAETNTTEIFEWTKGIPSVLTTLIGVNQLRDGG